MSNTELTNRMTGLTSSAGGSVTVTAPDTAPRAEIAPGLAAMQGLKFRIPGDVIAKTCADLQEHQRAAIKWASGFCRARNLSTEEFGALLQQPNGETYSSDSVYQVFTGRRDEGSVERFAQAVITLRRRVEETAPRLTTVFVQTGLTRAIWRVCDMARKRRKMSFIFGPSQIGKTTALAEYAARNNHGETHLVRMPTRGSMGDFLGELALRLGIGTQHRHRDVRRRIMECFDEQTLLIIDEAHQCLSSNYSDRALASLEFCREIYDRRHCGVVLCGTDVLKYGLRNNRVLQQLWLRRYRPLQLPAVPGGKTLAEFAEAFGLGAAEDRTISVETAWVDDEGEELTLRTAGNPLQLQTKVVKEQGLGLWLSLLEDAAESARERAAKLTWGRVIATHAQMQSEGI